MKGQVSRMRNSYHSIKCWSIHPKSKWRRYFEMKVIVILALLVIIGVALTFAAPIPVPKEGGKKEGKNDNASSGKADSTSKSHGKADKDDKGGNSMGPKLSELQKKHGLFGFGGKHGLL